MKVEDVLADGNSDSLLGLSSQKRADCQFTLLVCTKPSECKLDLRYQL